MANHKDMISSEEARIMLLEQKNDDFHQSLNRIDKKLDKLDGEMNEIRKDMKSDFCILMAEGRTHHRWTIGLISGLYLAFIGTLSSLLFKFFH